MLDTPSRAAANAENLKKPDGPRKLYVGNLHPNINEIMLKAVFEPFGMVSVVCGGKHPKHNDVA